MLSYKWAKIALMLFALAFLSGAAAPSDAWARVGGGTSSGSRGSRSATPPRPYTAPRPTTSTPYRPTPAPVSPARPGFFGSFWGGMATGFLGGMLLSRLGFMPYGMGGGFMMLINLLFIAAIIYGIYYLVKGQRQTPSAGPYQSEAPPGSQYAATYPPAYDQPPPAGTDYDLEAGLSHVRQMDPSFDEARFQDFCMDFFFKLQGAWTNRDISPVRNLLTPEMYGIFQADVDRLHADKQINRLENIAVRSVDITEAWQESGLDYITVRFYANLLDYTVEENTGEVMAGSKTDPVKFEEYWTFVRPVGNNPWQLSAINQPA
jgi:predicted lipid-binding transport protein (Tim44 family)